MDSERALWMFFFLVPFIAGGIFIAVMMGRTVLNHSLFNLLGHNPLKYFSLRLHELPAEYMGALEKFDYYKTMPSSLQRIFRHRMAVFLKKKKFIAKKGLEITPEMKGMIAACAIQVSFGMTEYTFSRFGNIIIFPGPYYSANTGRFHLGEANPRGSIVFSWSHFLEGYTEPHDNRNLGLHEFAHALFLSGMANGDNDPRLTHYYEMWRETGNREIFRMRKENKGYLRNYAATNLMEFFAVSVEYFFEAPNALRKELPDLYDELKKLLGQDPSRWVMA